MGKHEGFDILTDGPFDIACIHSSPPRLESKVVFDRDDISQKLVFSLMEITHDHGFGCSPPYFQEDDDEMVFMIGTIIPSRKSINKYAKKLQECLIAVDEFACFFGEQLDFSNLDISMFTGVEFGLFFPEQIAVIRDQYYDGCWESFYEDLIDKRKTNQADLVKKCVEFEVSNKKDMGFVGHKLFSVMKMLENTTRVGDN